MKRKRLGFIGLGLAAALLASCSTEDGGAAYDYYVFATLANAGKVSAYSMSSSSGSLTEVAGSPFTAGTEPQSVAVDPVGQVRLCGQLFLRQHLGL